MHFPYEANGLAAAPVVSGNVILAARRQSFRINRQELRAAGKQLYKDDRNNFAPAIA
jgi:hypothetical protein